MGPGAKASSHQLEMSVAFTHDHWYFSKTSQLFPKLARANLSASHMQSSVGAGLWPAASATWNTPLRPPQAGDAKASLLSLGCQKVLAHVQLKRLLLSILIFVWVEV